MNAAIMAPEGVKAETSDASVRLFRHVPIAMTPDELREHVDGKWAGSAQAQTRADLQVEFLSREAGSEWCCPECECTHIRKSANGPECIDHGVIGECLGERDEFGGFPNAGECDGFVVSGYPCKTCGIVANF